MRVLLALILLTGCAHSDPLGALARAGTSYSTELDEALEAARISGIDSSSWLLLNNDDLKDLGVADLDAADEQDRARLATLARLQEHADLLSRYLHTVAKLVNDGFSDRLSKSAKSLFTSAKSLSETLGANAEFPPSQVITEPLKQIAEKIRKVAIYREILPVLPELHEHVLLHEAILVTLEGTVAKERAQVAQISQDLLVRQPLVSEDAVPELDDWAEARRTLLLMDTSATEVEQARRAAKRLRGAIETLARDGLDEQAIAELMQSIEHPEAP